MSELPTRQLGKNGPQVTALGFGAMGLSAFYGPPALDEERLKVLDRAYDLGERFWDSADAYMDNEALLGKWFQKNPSRRNDIFLSTKFGYYVDTEGRRSINSDPEYVKQACNKSLRQLGLETIDLYYCHRVDQRTPIEKTVEAMVELKKYVMSFC
jgi:aryl-alcohol dehydrogenase-like predicted oxidoreductase